MIQLVIENLQKINKPKRFLFIVRALDCKQFHLDRVLRLLTNDNCQIVQLQHNTKGAACSTLLLIGYIDSSDPLLICNGDQYIDHDLNDVLDTFALQRADGGTICFDSVYPKWSYVRLEDGHIVEAAEKRPISRNAVAGFYYFREGADFVQAAQRMIKKDASVNGIFYISLTLNEMILDNRNLITANILSTQYHSFYSPQKINEFENQF